MDRLRVEQLWGADIARHIDAIADLRIAVFRDWPYLYEGSREYEARYLAACRTIAFRCGHNFASR